MTKSPGHLKWPDHKVKERHLTQRVRVEANGETYTLAFTCKPNECGDNQLFVLFSPSGAKAWGLLQIGNEKKWFGAPDKNVQDAILSAID